MIPEGNLSEFSLADLLQIVSLEEGTGTLSLAATGRSGAIVVNRGAIVSATCGPKAGDEAVYALFLWEGGQFRWEPDRLDALAASVTMGLSDLTREGISRRDLWHVARDTLPSLDAVFCRKSGAVADESWGEDAKRAWEVLGDGLTIGDLGRRLGVSPAVAANALVEPWQAGTLDAQYPPSELAWIAFGRLLAEIVTKFAEISGLKMIEGLADWLSDRAQRLGLDVQVKQEAVLLGETPTDDPTEACRAVLADAIDQVARIHGREFIDRLCRDHLQSATPAEQSALGRLGLDARTAAQATGE
ncbi:MAG: DUF4388 domain-containing protein [Cyanobacteria bacterium REEB65]|nr:DUF4388 domain-containing protein [Cyanobacteria bacterium REEB65]